MKCVKTNTGILRVKNDVAAAIVAAGKGRYTTKSARRRHLNELERRNRPSRLEAKARQTMAAKRARAIERARVAAEGG